MAMRGLADGIVMAFVRLNPARLYRMRPRLPSPARFAWFDCLLRCRQTGRVPGKPAARAPQFDCLRLRHLAALKKEKRRGRSGGTSIASWRTGKAALFCFPWKHAYGFRASV